MPGNHSKNLTINNKKAKYNYQIELVFEAGIILEGKEVKSLRAGKASIENAYALEKKNEIWMQNFFIENKFDLILADPPYGKEYLVNILEFVTRNDLLKSDGILVIEDDVRSELELNNNFKLIEKKNYGKTQLIFLVPN